MFLAIIAPIVLTLETSEMSAILFSQPKPSQPRPQVSSVNGALTCKEAALLTSSVDQSQNSSKFSHQGPVVRRPIST